MKTRDGSSSGASARTSNGSKSSGKGKGGAGEKKSTAGHNYTCGYCSKKGHWARECRKKKHDEEAHAHITVGDEEEQSMLLAHDIAINPPSSPAPVATEFKHRPIRIDEQRVYTDLSSVEGHHHDRWVLDTGATNHMTDSQEVSAELDMHVTGTVKFGDGSVTKIEGKGSILLTCKNGAHRTLMRVYFIPRLQASIISVEQLDKSRCRVMIHRKILSVFDPSGQLLAKVERDGSRLYHLTLHIGRSSCMVAHTNETAWLWHARFDHLNFNSLRQLSGQNMMHGMLTLDHVDQVCDGCLIGKQRRASFPGQAHRRAESILELVHDDLCGLITPSTPSGNKYFLLVIDDLSRYMWAQLLSSKDQASSEIKNFQASIKVETGKKMKILCTDRGGSLHPWSSAITVLNMVWSATSPHCILCNKMGWWNDVIKPWWPWRAACSRQRCCKATSGERPSP
jgi:hypothetical protein